MHVHPRGSPIDPGSDVRVDWACAIIAPCDPIHDALDIQYRPLRYRGLESSIDGEDGVVPASHILVPVRHVVRASPQKSSLETVPYFDLL